MLSGSIRAMGESLKFTAFLVSIWQSIGSHICLIEKSLCQELLSFCKFFLNLNKNPTSRLSWRNYIYGRELSMKLHALFYNWWLKKIGYGVPMKRHYFKLMLLIFTLCNNKYSTLECLLSSTMLNTDTARRYLSTFTLTVFNLLSCRHARNFVNLCSRIDWSFYLCFCWNKTSLWSAELYSNNSRFLQHGDGITS